MKNTLIRSVIKIQSCALCFMMIMFGYGFGLFAQTTQKPLYLDPQQPVEKRVKDLISRLSVEEKAILLDHRAPDTVRQIFISDKWNQALHGVWWNRPTTMFPIPTAMGATWDPVLINEVATVTSDEARAIYNAWHTDPNFQGEKKGLIYRSPVINISRNPYWGRINEIYSEDPFLTGRIGVAYVKGLQGNDPKYLKLVSTLKHYAVNNVEANRQSLSATVGERWLYEYWLPHFKDCFIEGQAQSTMASYNAINGVPNNINKYLLTDILKKQWGFQGFVVSDLGGVRTMVQGHAKGQMTYEEAVAKSLMAGCDFSDTEFRQYIPKAIQMGILTMERLDDAVYRVMRDRFRLGEYDPPEMVPYSKIPFSEVGNPEHKQLSLKLAQKSIVLLKNKNNFLPLDKNKIKTLAVIGPHANIFTAGGYSGRPITPVTPLQGIKNRAASQTEILYTAGAEIPANRRQNPNANQNASQQPVFNREEELKKAVEMAKKADVVILYIGTTLATEAEGRDRTTLALPGNQEELVEAVMAVNPKTVVVEMNAGPLAVPWIKDNVPAVVEAWWGGEEGGNAIADVLFGNVNPGGKLPLTVYASDSQVPPQDEYDVSKGFTYMYIKGEPLFPFGHGLSYTQFKYSKMTLSSKTINANGQIVVSVDVKNTGKREGDEVVQLYIHDLECSVVRPIKELRGFQRISLKPGETKTVTITVPGEKLSFYDEKTHQFVVEPGTFDVLVGSSSEDIRLKGQFDVVNK
jgi:beta-glucosidase